jgi:molecular chaperone GrpE
VVELENKNNGRKENKINEEKQENPLNERDKELEELRQKSNEYKETLQRLQADFENFRKRLDKERDDYRKLAGAKVISDFLPLYDTLNEAVKQAEKSKNEELKSGMQKVLAQFLQILRSNGVEEINTEGKKFDLEMHECIMTGNDKDKEDGIVLEEFQKGFTINGFVLRPAKVKINKKG